MNGTQRVLVTVGVVVVAAVGFVLLKATDDSSISDHPSGQTTITIPADTTTIPDDAKRPAPGRTTARARAAEPAVPRIVVRDLEPVDGVRELVYRKGDTIRFSVESDQPEEVHLHGYDIARDVAPGQPATFAAPANIEGIFEAELEQSGTQIASITVEP